MRSLHRSVRAPEGTAVKRTPIAQLLASIVAMAVLLGCLGLLSGCDGDDESPDPAETTTPDEAPAAEQPAEEEPAYTAWTVYVNDEDSYDEEGITYTIALNLTATNPTPEIMGEYIGTATASTSSVGEYMGQQLNASAIANSSSLTFELLDATGEGALAPLTSDAPADYFGTGSIVMAAAGGGTYGAAGGSFSNTSGQNLTVTVTGSDVTLKVTIDGHEYTFDGTISGQ
jgi:hypothetical protein